MKKYFNFLLSFISSKFASLLFIYILYNFHDDSTWKSYSLYLINVSLFRNITLSFTSNLGHEGLLSKTNKNYVKLFSSILFVVFSLQTIGLIIYFFVGENDVFIYSYLFAVISSFQGIVQNFQRFSLKYNDYSKSTLLFSFGNLIVVGVFFFNDLNTYLVSLILISLILFLIYFKLFVKIIRSFEISFFVDNIKKLSISSIKLYLINTFPDSLFLVYVPLFFSSLFSDVDYAALVFLISLFGIKTYPIITLSIQKNMDLIKKYHFQKNHFLNQFLNFVNVESKVILLISLSFLLFEIFYITFFAKPLMIIIPFFGFILWILPLVFLRHFVNSIIEVKKDLKYKIPSFIFSVFLLIIMYFFDKVDIFNIVIVYFLNLIHLTLRHIKSKLLTFTDFFIFYKNYFIIGFLFHLNYLINLSDLIIPSQIHIYLFFSVLILLITIFVYKKLILNQLTKKNFLKRNFL